MSLITTARGGEKAVTDVVLPCPPSRGRAIVALGVAALLSVPTASAVSARAAADNAFDLANTRGSSTAVSIMLTAGEDLATALVVEEDAHRRIVDWTYYEFGGSRGVEVHMSGLAPACSL